MPQPRRRIIVVAVVSVAALVGVTAVSIAALRSPERDKPQVVGGADVTPPGGVTGAVADTPVLRCPASSVDLGVSGLFGPSLQKVANSAAEDGEEVLVYPGAEEVRARGVVNGPEGQPRVVFRLEHTEGVWNLDQTSACLRPEPAEAPCGPVVQFDGAEYKLVEGEPDVGVGGIVGQARLPECSTLGISDPDVAGFDGSVFPATAYTVMEIDPAEDISMYINGDVRVLRRISAEPATDPDVLLGGASAGTLDCPSSSRQAVGLAPLEGLVYFPDLRSVSRYYFGDTRRPIVEVDAYHVIITDTEAAPQVRLIVDRDDEGWGVTTMEACADATLPPLGGVG